MPETSYDGSQIRILEGLEAVRKRPGMYIGSTDSRGLHHLVYEMLDNSVDEAMAGYATDIWVKLGADGSCIVRDNGRGIPVDTQLQTGRPAVEVVFMVLHAGGKFDNMLYKTSGGLHGVGASVVNALSEFLEVEVHRNGQAYRMQFSRGKVVQELEVIGESNSDGTTVTFIPDSTMFSTTQFRDSVIESRLKELAYLNSGINLHFIDEKSGKESDFYSEGGVQEFVDYLCEGETKITDTVHIKGGSESVEVEVAISYVDTYQESITSFANNIHTVDGGNHEYGFKQALTKTMLDFGRNGGGLKDSDVVTGDDIREGLVSVISVKVPEPQFEGQTKTKLGNEEVRVIVERAVTASLQEYLAEHPGFGKTVVEKALQAHRAREAAKKARDLVKRKGAFDIGRLPGKLTDCTSRKVGETELFIVEGDSAGGSAKEGRDRHNQAILPLRGKILNAEKARLDKILANNEVRSMVTAIGAGIGDGFDLSKMRYGKIIIMTDADVDGSHIRTLLLTFFYRFMKASVADNRIFAAQPPLYLYSKGNSKSYFYSDEELEAARVAGKIPSGAHIQRYKGLGEMNPQQLWDTTMNPDSRILKRVTLEDGAFADHMLSVLMGSMVEPRRKFIYENAIYAKTDI